MNFSAEDKNRKRLKKAQEPAESNGHVGSYVKDGEKYKKRVENQSADVGEGRERERHFYYNFSLFLDWMVVVSRPVGNTISHEEAWDTLFPY